MSVLATLALTTFLAACAAPSATPLPGTDEPAVTRIPVIVDADFDLSDIAAIAVLLRDPKVDVRAIAIDGTGVAHCEAGRRLARYVLDEMGVSDIPLGCGREDPGADGHAFPEAWRAAADADFGLDVPTKPGSGSPGDAVGVIRDAVAGSESAPTIVALGPLTNLEDAFAADSTLADRLASIQAMLGAVTAPGNVTVDGHTDVDQLEWNAYADPSAVAAVLDTDVPIGVVPLDATDDVPIPPDLAQRLADLPAAGADLVHELLVRNPSRLAASQGQDLWDELTALSVTNPDLVDWKEATVTVDPDGRLIQDDAGQSIRYAAGADRDATVAALVEALSRGDARATPFRLAGQLGVTYDGRACTATGHTDRDGAHRIDFKSTTGKPAGVAMIGTVDPHTWQDVLDLLHSKKPGAAPSPPDWLVVGPTAFDAAGDGKIATSTGDLGEGFYGPICFAGEFAQGRYVAGTPFEVGSGAVGG